MGTFGVINYNSLIKKLVFKGFLIPRTKGVI